MIAVAERELPDPNSPSTFMRSIPLPDPQAAARRFHLYHHLLALRRTYLVPRLRGARALGAHAIGVSAVSARWRLGDGSILAIATNLGKKQVPLLFPDGELLFESRPGAAGVVIGGRLAGETTIAKLDLLGGR
jgi:maltooligosyltrehalose trehalohydrolase